MYAGRTHWQLIEQGFLSALTVLQALHEHAGIDPTNAAEELPTLWAVAKANQVGDYAYDTSAKVRCHRYDGL